MGTHRTFIAFDTPETIRTIISGIQSDLRGEGADVRWEHPSKFHVTIKFLGDVDEEVIPDVRTVIADTVRHHGTFDVIYAEIGAFPSIRRPRVIWAGIKSVSSTLEELKSSLDRNLLRFGFEPEARAFHPHVTLGRVKSPAGLHHLTPKLEKCIFEPHQTTIHEILFMRSVLTPEGSKYSLLTATPLQR